MATRRTKDKPTPKKVKKSAVEGKARAAAGPPALPAPPPLYERAAPPSFDGEAGRLWQRILDDPDDLETRRILADLLLERGDPLGEYIQLAIQLGDLDPEDPRHAPMLERATTLRYRHILPWTRAIAAVPPLAGPRQPYTRRFALHRGLVEELKMDVRALDTLPLAARVAPIRRVEADTFSVVASVGRADDWARALAAMPELSRIRSLQLATELEDSALALLASPHLERLERLVIAAPATPRLARAIAASKACASLVELRLTNRQPDRDGIGAEGAAALAALPLRSLALTGQRIGEGLPAIAAMSTLRSLTIESDAIGVAGATAIARAPALSELRRLELDGTELGLKGLTALAASPVLSKLRALQLLGSNGLNGKAIEAMLAGWTLGSVTELRVAGPLREQGARAIASAGVLDGLVTLGLVAAGLKDDGVAALARWAPDRLADLDLSNNGIGPDGMTALAKGPLLGRARSLMLRNNKCGTEGGKALAEAPWLAHLQRLSLFYNWMGVLGVRAILERMPEAEELTMGENNYGTEPLRVASRGLLPRLRKVEMGMAVDEGLLQTWLARDDTRRLRSLHLSQVALSPRTVELLGRLPELEDLHLTFCSFPDGALDGLHERFGGLLGFWPGRD